jgi:hypothetical protein
VPQIFRTDPKNALPPTVGGWAIIFTRKVAAGTASDVGYVDTGIVYDPDFEFAFVGCQLNSPSADPDINASLDLILLDGGSSLISGVWGKYKPDGISVVNSDVQDSMLYIPSKQTFSALASDKTSGGTSSWKLDTSGRFWTKWVTSPSKDAHWCIARRQRYG